MKRILITGENSYIGQNFKRWLQRFPQEYLVETISVRGNSWKDKDFSQYDVVLHLAGIAHVSKNPKMEELYYEVNRDLTISIANKAKLESVKQFIFMSSIIVYGESKSTKKVITSQTLPVPSNFYGRSKLEAEEGIKLLESDDFIITIIRPPMIYGKNSKGNYPKLGRLAQLTPVFPNFPNERSMLHIDNLCEFIKLIIDNSDSGLYFPQNKEFVNTSKLVQEIGAYHKNNIRLTKIFNPLIRLFFKFPIISKIFGNLVYDKRLSDYHSNYQIKDFKETIRLTEGEI